MWFQLQHPTPFSEDEQYQIVAQVPIQREHQVLSIGPTYNKITQVLKVLLPIVD